MKSFLRTFAMSLFLCYIFLFFGGAFIFENIWAILTFIALIITIQITAFVSQETKIEQLELRIKTLESQNEVKE